jgi:hypothetical protein
MDGLTGFVGFLWQGVELGGGPKLPLFLAIELGAAEDVSVLLDLKTPDGQNFRVDPNKPDRVGTLT